MARSRGRMRNNARDRIMPPVLSPRILTRAFAGFFAVILLFVRVKIPQVSFQSVGSKITGFQDPSELPVETLKNLDAVLVLGGGRPISLEEPPVYVQRRCDDAAAVVSRYNGHTTRKKHDSLPVLCLSAGTAHLPQLMSASGLPIWESTSAAAYLQKHHNFSHNVYVETTSYDTIGNAFFARTSHTDVVGWRQLLIVTNKVRHSETDVFTQPKTLSLSLGSFLICASHITFFHFPVPHGANQSHL